MIYIIIILLAIAAFAYLYADIRHGKQEEAWGKIVHIPELYPMGEYTYPIACRVCKHQTEGKDVCRECMCQVSSGFEFDGEAADELSRDKKNIELAVLRAKCKRLEHEVAYARWKPIGAGTPAPNEMVWTLRRFDDLTIAVEKEIIDEDGHWSRDDLGGKLTHWKPMPELP